MDAHLVQGATGSNLSPQAASSFSSFAQASFHYHLHPSFVSLLSLLVDDCSLARIRLRNRLTTRIPLQLGVTPVFDVRVPLRIPKRFENYSCYLV